MAAQRCDNFIFQWETLTEFIKWLGREGQCINELIFICLDTGDG